MAELLAFHNDPTIKLDRIARVEAHIAADNLLKGATGNGGKGCAVWCTLDAYDHGRYPIEMGIPKWLARVEDTLFEGMSINKSRTWPKDFLIGINTGADLEKARGPFLIAVLNCAKASFDHAKFPDVVAALDRSIALWQRTDVGSAEWQHEAGAASRAAGAAWAAWAAADAAWAAAGVYDKLADELLEILRAIQPEPQS